MKMSKPIDASIPLDPGPRAGRGGRRADARYGAATARLSPLRHRRGVTTAPRSAGRGGRVTGAGGRAPLPPRRAAPRTLARRTGAGRSHMFFRSAIGSIDGMARAAASAPPRVVAQQSGEIAAEPPPRIQRPGPRAGQRWPCATPPDATCRGSSCPRSVRAGRGCVPAPRVVPSFLPGPVDDQSHRGDRGRRRPATGPRAYRTRDFDRLKTSVTKSDLLPSSNIKCSVLRARVTPT